MIKGKKEVFYLTTYSTHFIYGYMASDIWLRSILIVRKETRCRHIGFFFQLTARVLLYAPSHRQDSTYHGLCYTSRGALAGTRNSSIHDQRPPASSNGMVGRFIYISICMYGCMTTSMYCLYVGFDYTYIDVNALAQGIKSFLVSLVWSQAIVGTDSPAITSQPR